MDLLPGLNVHTPFGQGHEKGASRILVGPLALDRFNAHGDRLLAGRAIDLLPPAVVDTKRFNRAVPLGDASGFMNKELSRLSHIAALLRTNGVSMLLGTADERLCS